MFRKRSLLLPQRLCLSTVSVVVAGVCILIVTEGNVIKNSMIPVNEHLDDETMLKMNILLNTHLNGLAIEEINLGMIAALKAQAGIHSDIVGEVIDAVAETIKEDEDLEIYTSGTNNIFKYPELADQHKASELINTFEEKQLLNEMYNQVSRDFRWMPELVVCLRNYTNHRDQYKTLSDYCCRKRK